MPSFSELGSKTPQHTDGMGSSGNPKGDSGSSSMPSLSVTKRPSATRQIMSVSIRDKADSQKNPGRQNTGDTGVV